MVLIHSKLDNPKIWFWSSEGVSCEQLYSLSFKSLICLWLFCESFLNDSLKRTSSCKSFVGKSDITAHRFCCHSTSTTQKKSCIVKYWCKKHWDTLVANFYIYYIFIYTVDHHACMNLSTSGRWQVFEGWGFGESAGSWRNRGGLRP